MAINVILFHLPLQAQNDGHEYGCAKHDVGDRVDEIWVQHGVDHSVKLECTGEAVINDKEGTEQRVDDGQDDDERVETVTHFLPVYKAKSLLDIK